MTVFTNLYFSDTDGTNHPPYGEDRGADYPISHEIYPKNTAISTNPSQRSIRYLVKEKSQSMTIESTITARSIVVIPWICIGEISPVTPRIMRMLKTLDPNTLPMAIPLSPFRAATTLVASSEARCRLPRSSSLSRHR